MLEAGFKCIFVGFFSSLHPVIEDKLCRCSFVQAIIQGYVTPNAVFKSWVACPWTRWLMSCASHVVEPVSFISRAAHITWISMAFTDSNGSPCTIVLEYLTVDAEALRLVLRLVVSASFTKNGLLFFERRVPNHIAWCSKARKRLYLWFKDQWSFFFLVVRIYRLWIKNSSRLTPVLSGSRFSRVQYSLPRLQMFWRAVLAVDE